jgi:hypothetical protein
VCVLFIGPGMQGKLDSVSDTAVGSTMPLQNPLRLLRPSFSNFLFLSLTTVKTSQRTAVLSAISTGHARLLPPSLSLVPGARRRPPRSLCPCPRRRPTSSRRGSFLSPASIGFRRGGHGRSGGGSTLGRPPPPTPSSRFETWLDYS